MLNSVKMYGIKNRIDGGGQNDGYQHSEIIVVDDLNVF